MQRASAGVSRAGHYRFPAKHSKLRITTSCAGFLQRIGSHDISEQYNSRMNTTFTIRRDLIEGPPPEKFSITSTFRALRHRKFAVLLFGQTLSRIGDFLFQIAVAWWVLEKTGSATAMGGVLFFSILPPVIFSLIAGAVVDRMRRWVGRFLSDAARWLNMGIRSC